MIALLIKRSRIAYRTLKNDKEFKKLNGRDKDVIKRSLNFNI